MEVGDMEVIKRHWDFAPGERKISKRFKGAQGGTLKMAILVKSPMGAPKKYLNFFFAYTGMRYIIFMQLFK